MLRRFAVAGARSSYFRCFAAVTPAVAVRYSSTSTKEKVNAIPEKTKKVAHDDRRRSPPSITELYREIDALMKESETTILSGNFPLALKLLNQVKGLTQVKVPSPTSSQTVVSLDPDVVGPVDYLRALCFLRMKDPFHARQALLEELRFNHGNDDARDLLHRVNSSLKASFELPESVVASEPLFATLYDSLKDHSMLNWPRLFGLYVHGKQVCEENIPGDFIECGVAGGGSTVLLATVIKHFSSVPRRIIACDTFEGMPVPDVHGRDTIESGKGGSAEDSNWATGTCAGSLVAVRNLADHFGVEVTFVPGLFQDTLPHLLASEEGGVTNIAMAHLDCDWYESTASCLYHVYPKLSQGAILQIDDYHYWDGCQQAVKEHFANNGLVPEAELNKVDHNAVWMRKR